MALSPDALARRRETTRKWKERNREHVVAYMKDYNRTHSRERSMVSRYGITVADFDQMLDAQGGICAICGTNNPSRWCVDHDHTCCDTVKTCGRCVRKILCHECNVGIGLLKESPTILAAAIEYLKTGVENRYVN